MAHELQPTVYIVIAPYLPINEPQTVGDWRLIPFAQLGDEDVVDAQLHEFASGIATAYAPSVTGPAPVGAFCRRTDGRVGDDPEKREHLVDLQRALVVAVVNVNETPGNPPVLNSVHNSLTSDNALVFAPGVKRDGGWTATVTGSRIRTLEGGLRVLAGADDLIPTLRVAPPPEVYIPRFSPSLDFEYADAAWQSLTKDADRARRLARAIDWLDLVWRNTESLTDELRVPAILAGFEVLLNGEDPPENDVTVEHARRLGALLDAADVPTAPRQWPNRRQTGTRNEDLSDLQWWYVKFAHLRHALMHGGSSNEDDWKHEGAHHVDLGLWWLSEAIKRMIVTDGFEDLGVSPLERAVSRAARGFMQANPGVQEASDSGTT